MSINLKDYQKLVKPGIHMVILYKNEEEVIQPIVSYIFGCLERNERCIYVSGDTNIEKLIIELKKEFDYDFYIEKGQLLMMDKSEAYSKSGEFIPFMMINVLKSLVNESLEMGYSGMGITGELSWVLNYEDGIERIYEYEWMLNDQIFNDYNMSAVCRYNIKKFSDEVITNIIQLHPFIIYNGSIHENPYYLPPIAYKQNNIAKYQVSTWLTNIEKYSDSKSEFHLKLLKLKEEKNSLHFKHKEKITAEYNEVVSKYLEDNKELLTYYLIDLAEQKILEAKKSTIDGSDFTGKNFKDIGNYYYESVMEQDQELYKKTFSMSNLMEKYSKDENIDIQFYQKIKGRIYLLNTKVEFTLNPTTNNPIAFIYTTNITFKDATDKVLNILMQEQVDFVVQSNRKLKQVISFSKDNNMFNFQAGNRIMSYDEFDIVLKDFYQLAKISGDDKIHSSIQAFDIIHMNKKHTNVFEFIVDKKTFYKQIVSLRFSDDIIYHLAYDVTELIEKERLISLKFKSILDEKEAAINGRSNFLARMSHDMRTPLSAIMGLTEFGIEESQNEEIKKYFKRIKVTSDYLLNLINDILDIQKIDNNKMEIRNNVNLPKELVEPILEMVNLRAIKKDIKINFIDESAEIPKYLIFDQKRISQIYINILSNAIKYSDKGSEIVWTSKYIQKDGKSYFINRIEDSGVGISEKFQKYMYEPFTTEENKLTKTEFGTGLGLAITKTLVDLMGGEIICESEVGKGTIFTLKIPVTEVDVEQYERTILKEKALYRSKSLKDKRILICEDTMLNAKILIKILEKNFMKTDLANNGQIGYEFAITNNYDCILMDIRMPIMDGIEATKLIREKGVKTPIIALSANAYIEDVEKSLNSGIDAHLSKPINRELLLKTIAELIE
jgi:signal transduction histidine kinase/CheY-like chemotaxis protein